MILTLGTLSAATLPPCGGTRQTPIQETVATMKAYGSTGCITTDKIFADFSDILVPAGVQAIPAAWQVNITEPFTDVHVIDFVQDNIGNPLKNTTPGVNNIWGIQYSVAVDVAKYPNKYITNVGVSQNGATAPSGTALIQKYVYDSQMNQIAGPPGSLSTPGSFVSTGITGQQWILVKEFITLNDGQTTAFTDRFLQSTVPEPGTYAMMGLGLAALGLISRRKKA